MAKFVTNAEGNFFVQMTRDGPFEWLTCTGVGDIDIPMGDRTPVYCPDPLNSGYFKIEGFVRGDAGAGTYSLTKPLATVYNFLVEQMCAFTGRINWVCRGVREDHRNYEIACILVDSEPSRRGIGSPVRGPEDTEARVNTNADISFILAAMIYPLAPVRQALTNTAAAEAVFFLPERCEDRCGEARALCAEGIMGLDRGAGYLYDAEVKKTHDGNSWQAAPTDPFTWGGNIADVLMMETVDGIRYFVFRGEPVAAAPPECSFSDDYGVTWTNVAMGAVVNIGVNAAELNGARIFACCDDGYIYRSIDQGVSWQAVEEAVETAEDLNDLAFYDNYGYCVAANGVFLRSTNSGETWDAVVPGGDAPGAGTNYLCCAVSDKGHLFIGTNDGRLFRSQDHGDNWDEWVDHGGGSIDSIRRDDYRTGGYVMGYVYNTATPVGSLYRSEDGGATWWEVRGMPANAGLNDLFLCDPNNIIVVGEPQGGTTFVAKATPA